MKTLILSLLLLFSHSLFAQNWYRVELIVFENLQPLTGGEVWDKYPGLPDTADSVTILGEDEAGGAAFRALKPSSRTLSGTYSALKKSSQYRPVVYQAWKQPALSASRARSVMVNSLRAGSEPWVRGNVRIRSSLYLHVEVDLAYYLQAAAQQITDTLDAVDINQPGLEAVTRLTETRRIKLNEIHYFDHPLFGAIVRVVRL